MKAVKLGKNVKTSIKNKFIVTRDSKELAAGLGLSPLDAIVWEVKLKMANQIISSAEGSDLTVTDIANLAGTSRARITKILKIDTYGISLDVLVRVLGAVLKLKTSSFAKILIFSLFFAILSLFVVMFTVLNTLSQSSEKQKNNYYSDLLKTIVESHDIKNNIKIF